MRSSYIPSLLVIVFAVLLTAFVAVGIQNDTGIFRRPAQAQIENPDASNPSALEPGAADFASVDLIMSIIPPSSSEEIRKVTFALERMVYYVRDDNPDVDIVSACIEDVSFYFIREDEPEYPDGDTFFIDPICTDMNEQDFVAEETNFDDVLTIDNYYLTFPTIETPFTLDLTDNKTISLNYWYPYDSFTLNTVIQVTYNVTYSDGDVFYDTIEPYIAWNIQTSGTRLWDVTLDGTAEIAVEESNPETYLYITDGGYDTVAITFARPLLYQITFPFFMVAMVLLLSLVPLRSERDGLLDISAAMLFGIFGLKGIIGPGAEMGQTILDIALIGLYVVLAFAAFMFFLARVDERRRDRAQ